VAIVSTLIIDSSVLHTITVISLDDLSPRRRVLLEPFAANGTVISLSIFVSVWIGVHGPRPNTEPARPCRAGRCDTSQRQAERTAALELIDRQVPGTSNTGRRQDLRRAGVRRRFAAEVSDATRGADARSSAIDGRTTGARRLSRQPGKAGRGGLCLVTGQRDDQGMHRGQFPLPAAPRSRSAGEPACPQFNLATAAYNLIRSRSILHLTLRKKGLLTRPKVNSLIELDVEIGCLGLCSRGGYWFFRKGHRPPTGQTRVGWRFEEMPSRYTL
jgi:hypothetical protein